MPRENLSFFLSLAGENVQLTNQSSAWCLLAVRFEQNQEPPEWSMKVTLSHSFLRERNTLQMTAVYAIVVAYEISMERGFLSNAPERDFCSLGQPGSGHGATS